MKGKFSFSFTIFMIASKSAPKTMSCQPTIEKIE